LDSIYPVLRLKSVEIHFCILFKKFELSHTVKYN